MVLKKIHNQIYANEGLTSQQAFEECVKILYVKIFDETHRLGFFFITKKEWGEISQAGQSKTFERRLKGLFEETKLEYREIFEPAEKLLLKPESLAFAVDLLEEKHLLSSKETISGEMFQRFVNSAIRAERGQFFTPPEVVGMMVEMIEPKANEIVIDPACGSGGFLTEAVKQGVKIENIFGVEINPIIARLAKMGLILAGGKSEQIKCANFLQREQEVKKILGKLAGFADVVLLNPPFGTAGKIRRKSILAEFELGRAKRTGQLTEILFLERAAKLLKNGGRMGIILPSAELSSKAYGYVRQFMKEKTAVKAIIDLPEGTFVPYGTSIRTAAVILEKRKSRGRIFFGRIDDLGYRANKSGKKTGKGDWGVILKAWKNKKEKKQCYWLEKGEVEDRIDFEFNRPKHKEILRELATKEVVELGELVTIVDKKMMKGGQEDKEVDYIEASDLNTKYLEIMKSKRMKIRDLPRRASFELKTGDILVAMAGNYIGTKSQAMAMVEPRHDGAICSNSLRVLRKPLVDRYYLLYYLRTKYFLSQIRRLMTGTTVPKINDDDFAKILVYMPSWDKIDEISTKMRKFFELKKGADLAIEEMESGLLA